MHASIPVTPDAETAREWAREELSRPEYRDEGTSWFEDFLEWVRSLFDGLDGLGAGLGVNGLVVVAVIAAGLVALLLWLVLGPLRRSRRGAADRAVFEDDRRTSAQMRAAALDAAGRRDWDVAVVEQFRAVVRRLDEHGTLPDMPGSTADEAAGAIAAARPELARVRADALAFDRARYGSGGLTEFDWTAVEQTWETARTVRTTRERVS